MSIATTNAIKISATSEHLINNNVYGKNYNESSFRILRKCFNYFLNVINLEAFLIKVFKPKCWNQKYWIIPVVFKLIEIHSH